MKYKAKLERLRQKQVWWDKLPQAVKMQQQDLVVLDQNNL